MSKNSGIKFKGYMTAPRYESTWARSVIEKAFKSCGVPLVVTQGVFYGQCMQSMFNSAVDEGVDYAITVDFDSVLTSDDLHHLMAVMARGEHDAVAAFQCSRGSSLPLFNIDGEDSVEVSGKPFKVDAAHFGLTGLSVSKLKSVSKPWFHSTPDENGEWNNNRIDTDIWFWRQWADAGNSVYVDARLRIGHLVEMIAGYDGELNHRFEYANEWVRKDALRQMQGREVQDG